MTQTNLRTGPLPRNYDGSTVCWYCGGEKMVPDRRGFVCQSCGATWSKQPTSLSAALVPGGKGAVEARRIGYGGPLTRGRRAP